MLAGLYLVMLSGLLAWDSPTVPVGTPVVHGHTTSLYTWRQVLCDPLLRQCSFIRSSHDGTPTSRECGRGQICALHVRT